ncbi:MAG TPA: hypothetical protein VGM64_12925 [Lacunisphaera sp.]
MSEPRDARENARAVRQAAALGWWQDRGVVNREDFPVEGSARRTLMLCRTDHLDLAHSLAGHLLQTLLVLLLEVALN